jgi:hypothetical protein
MTEVGHDEDGYDGPAELLDGERTIPVTVRLRGHFEPINGKYSWYGRVAASPEVGALVEAGARKVRLRTPHGEVDTALSDVDPWGRPRVEGVGPAPFDVLTTLPDQAPDQAPDPAPGQAADQAPDQAPGQRGDRAGD